jgi:hydrogenase maturation protease
MTRHVLVAGIGNIFFGDDGFGPEVVRRLATTPLPEGVRAIDYGIRGLHLAFELLNPFDLLIVVDLAPRGQPPGTLSVIEPEVDAQPDGPADGHTLDLVSVFSQVRSLGGTLPPVRLVGCEPSEAAERIGLSPAVERAVAPAVALVRELLFRDIGSGHGETPSASRANSG